MSSDNGINFLCSHCAQSLEAESGMAGREINCPACQKSITIPVFSPSMPQLSLRNFLSSSREANVVDPEKCDEKTTAISPKPVPPVTGSVKRIAPGQFTPEVKKNRIPVEPANPARLHDAYGRKKINPESQIKPGPDLHLTGEMPPDASSAPITLLIPHNNSTLSGPGNIPPEVISCNHCGAQHYPDAVICNLCGQSMNAVRQPQTVQPQNQHPLMSINRRCPGCGKSVTPEDVICIDCGLNLKTGKKAATYYETNETPESYVKYKETKASPPADYNVSSGLGPFGYIISGIILTVLGFGLTRHSYDAVASSGGQYTIYTGLMIIGIYSIFKGFFRWFGD